MLTFYLTNLQEIFFSEEKDIIMVYRNLDFKIRINPLKSKDDYFTSLYNYYSLLSQNTNLRNWSDLNTLNERQVMLQEQLHDQFDVIQFNYFSLTLYLLGFRK